MVAAYPIPTNNLHIGFVSTRLSTTDGVSLETEKWTDVLSRLGHQCFFFAGLCDRPADVSYVVPEAHFSHPAILNTYEAAFSNRNRPPQLTREIRDLSEYLKKHLYEFVRKYDIHILVVENALAIPLNIPLGVALTEFIAETGIHTVAHHHDLYWERRRFLVNCVWDYLDMCFPPRLPSIKHIVINSPAAAQLSYRRGISARLIPNVMDFDNPPAPPDEYASSVRNDLQIDSDEFLFLQPTRIVRRKGIEHAMELVRRLPLPARLVISHASGDEGDAYEKHLRSFSQLLDISTIFVSDIISDQRGETVDGHKVYSLWDVYPFADIVTYPSLLEGFSATPSWSPCISAARSSLTITPSTPSTSSPRDSGPSNWMDSLRTRWWRKSSRSSRSRCLRPKWRNTITSLPNDFTRSLSWNTNYKVYCSPSPVRTCGARY